MKFFGETFWIFTQIISLHIIFCHHQKKWERCMLLLCNCYCYCFSFSYCCTIVFTFWRSITRFPSFRHSSSAAGRPPWKFEDLIFLWLWVLKILRYQTIDLVNQDSAINDDDDQSPTKDSQSSWRRTSLVASRDPPFRACLQHIFLLNLDFLKLNEKDIWYPRFCTCLYTSDYLSWPILLGL